MNYKVFTRLAVVALVLFTLAACHESSRYDPIPEVVLGQEFWDYDVASGTYTLRLQMENIGDDTAYDVSIRFDFGRSEPIVYRSLTVIPAGSYRTVIVSGLLADYRDTYLADWEWYDYYGYHYSDYL